MTATTLEHVDVARQILATYGWRALVIDESYDNGLSLEEFHALQETVKIMRHNYLHLLEDCNYLLKRDYICYEALLGKERCLISPMSLRKLQGC